MVAEHLSFFTALGVVIVFLGALALGRLAVIGARDAQLAGDEVTWTKAGRSGTTETPAPRDNAAAGTDGERPGVWRRLTATR
jgi:hypothetical protein